MQKFGIAGWQNSGKTTLVKNLIPTFAKKGLTVSTIKHAHHNFDIDKPGKDSTNIDEPELKKCLYLRNIDGL